MDFEKYTPNVTAGMEQHNVTGAVKAPDDVTAAFPDLFATHVHIQFPPLSSGDILVASVASPRKLGSLLVVIPAPQAATYLVNLNEDFLGSAQAMGMLKAAYMVATAIGFDRNGKWHSLETAPQ